MNRVKVASVQFEHAPGDKAANMEIVRGFVDRAAADGADIVTFPECCISGYWHVRSLEREAIEELAEPVPDGPASRELSALAAETGMTVAAGLVEQGGDGELYNTYVVAMPDGKFAVHRKLHCFISGHMASGSEFTVFDDPHGVRVGVLICYDNNIVENVRVNALLGAELMLSPHQTGGCQLKNPHAMGMVDHDLWKNREADPAAIEAELRGDKGRGWLMRWLPSRAHDNGVFLAFSNGVGVDDDEIRTGNAMILDPYGRILAETWKAGNDMVAADLDPELLVNCTGRRWIATRRPSLYDKLTESSGE
ncbi:MAG: nitrilase family protein, partial [Planctomycetota bacterium]